MELSGQQESGHRGASSQQGAEAVKLICDVDTLTVTPTEEEPVSRPSRPLAPPPGLPFGWGMGAVLMTMGLVGQSRRAWPLARHTRLRHGGDQAHATKATA